MPLSPKVLRLVGCSCSRSVDAPDEQHRRKQAVEQTRISDPSSPRAGVIVRLSDKSIDDLTDEVAAEISSRLGPQISDPAPLQREVRIAIDASAPLGLRGLPYDFEQMLCVAGFTREEVLENAPDVLEVLRSAEARISSCFAPERPPSIRRYRLEDMLSDGDPLRIYTDLKLLDSGAQGQVFQALAENGDFVALKKIQMKDERKERLLFENEISMLHCCRHPNVVGLRACHKTGSTLWIGMELMDGGKLTDLIVGGFRFSSQHVGFLLLEVLKGLEYLHSTGRIHRDVKSDNVLVSAAGQVKLGDFGFCAWLSEGERMRRTVVGTPYWMAPEVIRGNPYDAKADVWSLGIVGVELCDSEPPHLRLPPMRALYVIARNPAPKVAKREKWPAELLEFIECMLVKRPAARPSSSDLLRHRYLRHGGGAGVADPTGFLGNALTHVRSKKRAP
eukprot:TRINITY_DN4884_c0_g1_i1.p1 TRINITY_DN4884_c0_g1~~TRINITY_DN4884_c0_g1_i1.p1  ORF type:complete len:464 (+),score=129.58 TRINITY_DN4884_c0_g1_i1:50-1393(+)